MSRQNSPRNSSAKFEQTYTVNTVNQLINADDIHKLVNDLFAEMNANRQKFDPEASLIPEFVVNDIELYRRAFTHKSFVDEQKALVADSTMQLLEELKKKAQNTSESEFVTYVTSQLGGMPKELDPVTFYNWVTTGKDTVGYIPYDSNERLEFLGDAIIKSVQGTYLFRRFPGKPGQNNEGFLTKLRIKLEQTKRLADFAKRLGFDKMLLFPDYLEKLTKKEQGRNNEKALENAFEAFIGAMIEDNAIGNGYEYCYSFIVGVMEKYVDFAELILKNDNFKASILTYFAKNKIEIPKNSSGKKNPYEQIYFDGPPNDRTFVTAVCVPKEYFDTLSPDTQKKIKDYQKMMKSIIRQNSSETGLPKWEEIEKTNRVFIGVGTERSKIKSEQLASKKALLNLGIPLNYS